MRIEELEKQVETKDKQLEGHHKEIDDLQMQIRVKGDKIDELDHILNKDPNKVQESNLLGSFLMGLAKTDSSDGGSRQGSGNKPAKKGLGGLGLSNLKRSLSDLSNKAKKKNFESDPGSGQREGLGPLPGVEESSEEPTPREDTQDQKR